MNPAHSPHARSFASRILRDLVGVAALAAASLAVGFMMNRRSPDPLPVVYQTPEQRFDSELTTLVAAPPFKIAPAATVTLDHFRSAVDLKCTHP